MINLTLMIYSRARLGPMFFSLNGCECLNGVSFFAEKTRREQRPSTNQQNRTVPSYDTAQRVEYKAKRCHDVDGRLAPRHVEAEGY
jgi:hypothetical protein